MIKKPFQNSPPRALYQSPKDSARFPNDTALPRQPRRKSPRLGLASSSSGRHTREVDGFTKEKTLEVRFFAPGNLVSNLDFVESIFGNGGDLFIGENDAALDPAHWTGHSGCVILAPHLMGTTKVELGLPNIKDGATERQKRDGMCWEKEDELYNDGGAFKITCRDACGVVVTAIADNYFGYCKKEVKTQIGFSANLNGLAEEEHAGGTLAFTGYDLGEDFQLSHYYPEVDQTFDGVVARYIDRINVKPEGYAVDKNFNNIIYLPEDARIDLKFSAHYLVEGRSGTRDQTSA